MPAITSFDVTTRDATPLVKTFLPKNIVGDVSYFNLPGATALADETVSISARTSSGGYRKVIGKGVLPVVSEDTSTGVSVFSTERKSHFKWEFTFAADATEAEMKRTVAFAYGTLADDIIIDEILTQNGNFY